MIDICFLIDLFVLRFVIHITMTGIVFWLLLFYIGMHYYYFYIAVHYY